MLPHAVASRSSERWSQIWSERERRVGLQPVALVDQLAGARRSARRGSRLPSSPRDHRLAVGPRPPRPRPGPAVADRRALERG